MVDWEKRGKKKNLVAFLGHELHAFLSMIEFKALFGKIRRLDSG